MSGKQVEKKKKGKCPLLGKLISDGAYNKGGWAILETHFPAEGLGQRGSGEFCQ